MASGKAMKKNFPFGLTRYFGAFPVFSSDPEPALRYSLNTLKKGLAVYISPQGGRISRTIFEDYFNLKEEGRTGVGRLILRMNGQVPVIPIYISRSAEVLGISEIIPQYKGRVLIVFGKPMCFHQYFRVKRWNEDDEFYQSAREITIAIMSEIHELLKTTEANYIQFLRIKTGQNIDELGKEMIKKRKFQEFLRRLDKVNPDELAKYLAEKSTNPL
jgi:1-acyl-sn-glycerol-3-phosphate acyltransferase